MGVSALESHASGARHQKVVEASHNTLKIPISKDIPNPTPFNLSNVSPSASSAVAPTPFNLSNVSPSASSAVAPSISTVEEGNMQVQVTYSSGKPHQSMFDKTLLADVNKAEVIWCLRTVYRHQSQNSCDGLNEIFPAMFPDSDIARNYQMGPDKLAYIVSYGIAPYFKDVLMKQLKQSSVKFVSSFDEAFNDVVNKGQFDVHVSFFDDVKKEVATRYLGSAFLGHSRSVDLMEAFDVVHKDLDITQRLVQVSMDGPNVNWALLDGIQQKKIDNDPSSPEILQLGSCGLHVLHGAYGAGQDAAEWKMKKFLISCYLLFKKANARRADYLSANEIDEEDSDGMFPLQFCGHRWLENGPAIDRILKILPNIKAYVAYIQSQPKSKRPSSEPFDIVQKALSSDSSLNLLLARLEFSRFICHIMEPFLSKFQSEKPLASLMYQDLMDMTRRLLSIVISDEVIANSSSTGVRLCQIDLEKNRKPSEKCDFGFGTKSQMKQISSPSEKLEFRKDCQKFVIAVLQKIFERSPLKYRLTRAISAISPSVIRDSKDMASKRFDTLLEILHDKKHVIAISADKAKEQFNEILKDDNFIQRAKDFEWTTHRIDQLYHDTVGVNPRFTELWEIIKLVLILSHGNARVESGFSINKDLLLCNMKQNTIVNQRIVYDAIHNAGGVCAVEINSEMRNSVRMARQRYHQHLKDSRQKNEIRLATIEIQKKRTQDIRLLEEERVKLLQEKNNELSKIDQKILDLKRHV